MRWLLLFHYNVDFRSLAEEHEPDDDENLSEELVSILVDRSYHIEMDQKDVHVLYDVFGSNNIKHIAKFLGNVMELRAHENLFSAAL